MSEQAGTPSPFADFLNPSQGEADLPRPQSVEHILAIAYTMEREAATRYGDLATCMKLVGRADLAELFGGLAAEEQHHIKAVKDLAQATLRRMPALAVAFQWQLPETFSAENRTIATDALSPYEALVTAVHNEERAFAFWTYVAAGAEDDSIRQQAEMMARQELLHAAALRVARRKAYRDGGRIRHRTQFGERDAAATRADLEARRQRVGQFLAQAAVKLTSRGDKLSGALLEFAAEEVGLPAGQATEKASDMPTHGLQGNSIAVLFHATGQIESVAEAALQCIEAEPELAETSVLPQLVKAANLQMAILNRRLCELDPRLAALVAPGGAGKSSV